MSKLALYGGEPIRKTPFHSWPIYGQEEENNLLEVVRATRWGIGKRTGVINKFEEEFAKYHNVSSAVACTNCTHALEIALSVSGVRAGDEVIIPAYTFIATASSVAKIGAIPIFADIDLDTLLINPVGVESLITSRTKAIVPVHFAGQMANMNSILAIAQRYELKVIEDAAQAHGAKRNGKYPGQDMPATFSFQYSKNMTAGEGGIIISNNKEFIDGCWEHIWHGRKKGGLWYEHFATTSNFRMTEWSAAVLRAQLQKLPEQNTRRIDNANYLTSLLRDDEFVIPGKVDIGVDIHARHLFPMRLNREIFGKIPKDKIVKALNAEGLPIAPGYTFPLYKNPAFQNGNWGLSGITKGYNYTKVHLPQAEQACLDTIWIVHHTLLGTKEDMEDIAAGIRKIIKNLGELKE